MRLGGCVVCDRFLCRGLKNWVLVFKGDSHSGACEVGDGVGAGVL